MDLVKLWLDNAPKSLPIVVGDDATELISSPVHSATDETNYSDPNIEIFRNPKNHVGATSSILSKCGNDASLIPDQTLDISPEAFGNYVARISSFPGFRLETQDKFELQSEKDQVNLFIDQLVDIYAGTVGVNVEKVTEAVKKMVNSMNSESTTKQSLTKFYQGSIANIESGVETIRIVLVYTNLALDKKESGKKTVETQKYVAAKVVYLVNTAILVNNAETLANAIVIKPLNDWLAETTSKGSDAITKNCLSK
jgi:hypothetical protein